jgi:hypothetical protein
MIGIDTLDRLLSGLVIIVALAVAAWFGVHHYGAERYDDGYAAATAEFAAAAEAAKLKRDKENTIVAVRQDATNATITKEKDDEIADLRRRLAAAPRLRVGPSVCPDRPAAPTQAQGSAGSNGTDPSAGLVSSRADADFKQLIQDVEQDLATARACQAFVRDNGLVP